MSNNLGFYGCNYDYALITDIMETWGDDLQKLEDCDRNYLIHIVSEHIGLVHSIWIDTTALADEVSARVMARELPIGQVQALMSAIINKSHCKPLGSWGLNFDLQLINDIYETYGDFLENLTTEESYDILNTLGWVLYVGSSGISSDEADEVAGRVEELPLGQLQALIQALGN